jgi:hypothetical protein
LLIDLLTVVVEPNETTDLFVSVSDIGSERFSYFSRAPSYALKLSFVFPHGTLGSDALPLELDLSSATLARFHIFPLITDQIAGDITTYTSSPVPEPGLLGVAGCIVFISIWGLNQENPSALRAGSASCAARPVDTGGPCVTARHTLARAGREKVKRVR